MGLHTAINSLYGDDLIELSDEGKTVSEFKFKQEIFNKAIRKIYKKKGYSEEVLSSKEGIAMIEETYNILNSQVSISERTPQKVKDLIDQNLWRFSGFKSDIQMREVANKLYNEKGELKSFKDFAADVKQIHHNYNINYLRSEYDHVARSVEMFNQWNDLEEDDELQYRTMQDNKVREDHRVLDGTTLPKSDPFWEMYYPPNGWNCRCTAKPVRSGKYKRSNSKAAIAKGNEATKLPKQQIFRTNPGKTLNLMPDKHPYYPKNCGDCPGPKKRDLAYDPRNPKCRACAIIEYCKPETGSTLSAKESREWINKTIEAVKNGHVCMRAITVSDMPVEVVEFAKANKLPLSEGGLRLSDKAIIHALRDAKKQRGQAISNDQMQNISENIAKSSIYYDDQKSNYVFVCMEENNIDAVKYVIQPEYSVKVNGRKEKGNHFITAGRIKGRNVNSWRKIK